MKVLLSSIFLFIYFQNCFALKPKNDSLATNAITVSTEYSFGSNALTNQLAKNYYRNDFISTEMKDNVSKKLSNENRLGIDFNYTIQYRHKTDSLFGLKNSFYRIKFRDVFHVDADFTNDAFELYFRGNKSYGGKTADLNNFEFRQLKYQQINFTFGHGYSKMLNNYEWSAGVSLNKGQQFLSIKAPRASLYTAETGEYLDLNSNITIRQSDSSKTNKAAVNGIGSSIDFSFKWTDEKKRTMKITLENLGFISWNDQSSFIHADTSFRFEGVDVSELFNFNDSIHQSVNLDSSFVQPYLSERTRHTAITPLPGIIRLSYSIPVSKYHLQIESTIGHVFFANSLPFIYQNYQYKINIQHSLGMKISYGGYSGIHLGLNYEFQGKGWVFRLKSDQVDVLLLKSGTAQGAFVSLSKYF